VVSTDGDIAASGVPQPLRLRLAARLGGGLVSALLSTCRYHVVGEEHYLWFWRAGRPVVFVLWHGRLLASAYQQRGAGLVALISQHRDGEYIARVVQRWGYGTVRGSSTRGGTGALRGLVRHVRRGRSVVLTPDGPRGPRERIKPGALRVAQMGGAPLIPVASSADRAWWVVGWDRFQIPKPFSRIRMAYGEPIEVPRGASEVELDAVSAAVEQALDRLMQQVDAGW
jgi:lysophospholipid acyltransferase (LPLAT)-like uncharacterized protein